MKFKFHIDGVVREVSADPAGEVGVDGGSATVKVEAPAPDRRVVEVNGKCYEIRVIENRAGTGEFVLELGGERIPVKAAGIVKEAPVLKKAAAAAPAAPAEAAAGAPVAAPAAEEVKSGVRAPMPGKILKVLVKPGQEVKEGDPVVVLEAMKMENELRSPVSGTVKAVLVAEGDQAGPDQLLIEFA
jgi:biotin carboxyl carrier protein